MLMRWGRCGVRPVEVRVFSAAPKTYLFYLVFIAYKGYDFGLGTRFGVKKGTQGVKNEQTNRQVKEKVKLSHQPETPKCSSYHLTPS